jgi:fructose-1-phosphate kinase PfkB-like protein
MPKIITITFNPALDKSTSVAELTPDKKLNCKTPVCEPGGGGINVARAIKKLGGDATAVYLAGGYMTLKKIPEKIWLLPISKMISNIFLICPVQK